MAHQLDYNNYKFAFIRRYLVFATLSCEFILISIFSQYFITFWMQVFAMQILKTLTTS